MNNILDGPLRGQPRLQGRRDIRRYPAIHIPALPVTPILIYLPDWTRVKEQDVASPNYD